MSIECERKYLNVDFVLFRQGLLNISAAYVGTNFESNSVWENHENMLMPSGMLLRLRTLKWFSEKNDINTLKKVFEKENMSDFFHKYVFKDNSDECFNARQKDLNLNIFDRIEHVLTLKKQSSVSDNCKVREELEVNVTSAEVMQEIFCGTGFKIYACYEKIRESWTHNNVHITMDLLPFINVIELEGSAQDINDLAVMLNISTMETSTSSYHTLHQKWRKQHKLELDNNFIFNLNQYSSLFV